jgi:MYXO-CTERM domain-containing protein
VQTGAVTATGNDMGTGGDGGATASGKSHGCSMGGAAASSPWTLAFVMLALAALVVRPRRRRQ